MSSITTDYSLYKLLENEISIPDYQRGYVQGVKDDKKIEDIRNNFVCDLAQALRTGEIVHMGLVYGSNNNSTEAFAAVDGQQRLTTDFLLHLYLARRVPLSSDDELSRRLQKFGWFGRVYSSEFVDFLQKSDLSALDPSKELSSQLRKLPGYYAIWERDPSVAGMEVMLDAIHEQFAGCSAEKMLKKLCGDDCPILFDYLPLEDGTDETQYMKMNSRGRELTTFEKFKNRYLEKNVVDQQLRERIGEKMDESWRMFFENNIAPESQESDVPMMNYINETLLWKYALSDSDKFLDVADLVEKSKPQGSKIDVGFVRMEYYGILDGETLEKELDWFLDNYEAIENVVEQMSYEGEGDFWKPIFGERVGWRTRVINYAINHYGELSGYKKLVESKFRRYLRPIHNLVSNSSISKANFCKAVEALSSENVLEDLAQKEKLPVFDGRQCEEEAYKLRFPQLEEDFLEKEKDNRFKGTIRMLFKDLASPCTSQGISEAYRGLNQLVEGRYDKGDYDFIRAMLTTEAYENVFHNTGKTYLKYWPTCLKEEGPVFRSIHQLLFEYLDRGKGDPEQFLSGKVDLWLNQPEAEKEFWINFMLCEPSARKSFACSQWGKLQWKDGGLWLYHKEYVNECDLLVGNMRREVIEALVGESDIVSSHVRSFKHPEYSFLTIYFTATSYWVGIKQEETVVLKPESNSETYYHKAWARFKGDTNSFMPTDDEATSEYIKRQKSEFDEFCKKFVDENVEVSE